MKYLLVVSVVLCGLLAGQPAKTRRDGWLCSKDKTGAVILETCKPNLVEELDVPAIQETQAIPEDERPTCKILSCPTAKGCFVPSACYPPDTTRTITTCADKARILEHDEQTPPKYWCRKVQP